MIQIRRFQSLNFKWELIDRNPNKNQYELDNKLYITTVYNRVLLIRNNIAETCLTSVSFASL